MSRRLRITLSDQWADWIDGESMHRCQSFSELIQDALAAFERQLISENRDRVAEAYHGRERAKRLRQRVKEKLTSAQLERVRLR